MVPSVWGIRGVERGFALAVAANRWDAVLVDRTDRWPATGPPRSPVQFTEPIDPFPPGQAGTMTKAERDR
jgi:hypothetical protein